VDEAIEVIHQWRWHESNDVEHLIKTVKESQEVIEIKINRLELSEDEYAWAMVDCIEAYIARESNGIIYATDDAFYDRNLQLMLKTSKN
jgi:predicted nucleic acid-binding protein